MIDTPDSPNDPVIPRRPEGSRAAEAWRIYRDGGAARSLDSVASKLRKSRALIERWSSRGGWVARAAAHDEEMDRLRLRVLAREAVREAIKWDRRRVDALESAYENAEKLRRTAEAMLSLPVVEEVTRDGKKTLVPTGQWRVRDAAVLLRATYEIQTGCLEAISRSTDGLSLAQLRAIAGIDEGDELSETAQSPDGATGPSPIDPSQAPPLNHSMEC